MNPLLPTNFLPRITRSLSSHPSTTLLATLERLQPLYSIPDKPARHANDSGYSSETDEEEEDFELKGGIRLGKDDVFERTFTKEWLLKIVIRGEEWVEEAEEEEEEERSRRSTVLDMAAALVASLSETSASGSILRPLTFETATPYAPLHITLHDALPDSLDPTSVGLQSWGSSIILAKMMALSPSSYGITEEGGRMLELGAGTGLLSLVWRGMVERLREDSGFVVGVKEGEEEGEDDIVATDYHPTVLDNLRRNIMDNSVPTSTSTPILPILIEKLDWSAVHKSCTFAHKSTHSELLMPSPFDKKFDQIVAADVIYGEDHARWIRSCVEQFLQRPTEDLSSIPTSMELLSLESTPAPIVAPKVVHEPSTPSFHLLVPLRPTHTQAIATIADIFPLATSFETRNIGEAWRLGVVELQQLERTRGIGRADEGGYRIYRICWC